MSEVLAVKTITNEEVIATIVEDNEDHYILEKPRVLVMQQASNMDVSLGLLPFMASSTSPDGGTEYNVKLNKKDIMAEPVIVPEALVKAYLKSVSIIELV